VTPPLFKYFHVGFDQQLYPVCSPHNPYGWVTLSSAIGYVSPLLAGPLILPDNGYHAGTAALLWPLFKVPSNWAFFEVSLVDAREALLDEPVVAGEWVGRQFTILRRIE
jgi:hypothetical protein